MSQWAQRRKLYYGLGVFIFLTVVISIPTYMALDKPPTCFDGIMNQDETDVDRGGPCQLLDSHLLSAPRVLWARTFPVREGVSNVLVYLENGNQAAGARQVPYQVRLYDSKNIIVAERVGVMDIIPSRVISVFEGGIETGNRVPVRAFFSFLTEPVWERMANPVDGLSVRNIQVSDTGTMPRLEAQIQNTTIKPKTNIVLVVSLFDEAENAFAGSRTVVDRLEPGEEKDVAFTWPYAFTEEVTRVDVVPVNAGTK